MPCLFTQGPKLTAKIKSQASAFIVDYELYCTMREQLNELPKLGWRYIEVRHWVEPPCLRRLLPTCNNDSLDASPSLSYLS